MSSCLTNLCLTKVRKWLEEPLINSTWLLERRFLVERMALSMMRWLGKLNALRTLRITGIHRDICCVAIQLAITEMPCLQFIRLECNSPCTILPYVRKDPKSKLISFDRELSVIWSVSLQNAAALYWKPSDNCESPPKASETERQEDRELKECVYLGLNLIYRDIYVCNTIRS
ncbi:hypothetical protein GJ496_010956 [Pomphorhynchus laevis]|nr:hypothetical protein GJ496_010956 [Pomphorhynchus laevis]